MGTKFPVAVAFTEAVELYRSPTAFELAHANLFRMTPNTGLVRGLGADPEEAVVPFVLAPTNVYFQEILRRLRADGLSAEGPRWPLRVRCARNVIELTASIRLVPPNVLVTTAKIRGHQVDEHDFVADLIALQEYRSHGVIPDIMRWTAEMVGARKHRPISETTFRKAPGGPLPAVHLMVPKPSSDVSAWADNHDRELLATLIRDQHYRFSDPRLRESLVKKNSELNLKGGSRRWVDKQGALLVNSAFDERRSSEFTRLVNMQALVLAMQTLFSEYPRRRKEAPYSFDFVVDKALVWVREPGRALRQSVGGQELWSLLADEFALSDDADKLFSDVTIRERLDGDREVFASIVEWWDCRNLEDQLACRMSERPVKPPPLSPVVQIINAKQAQVAGRDINNFLSFDDFLDALAERVDSVTDVDVITKDEALSLISRLRAAAGTVATATVGGAGATLVGAALKQLLGLP